MSSGIQFSDLIADTLDILRQPAANYNRYSLVNIKRALNEACEETARRLECLHSFAIIILSAGFGQYPPPSDMLVPKKAFFYKSSNSYLDLVPHGWMSREWLDSHVGGWRTSTGDPCRAYIGDIIGNLRKIGFTPTPNTDGTDYASNPDVGLVTSISGLTTTGNILGRSSVAHATICTDEEGRTLSTLGALVGMVALNITDGSSGQITDVTGSTFTVTLTGGTLNTWSIGDSWTILAGEYGIVTNIGGDEAYIFSANVGELISISALTGNVYLEYVRRPLLLTVDTQYPEVPPETHRFLPEYAAAKLKRRGRPGSDDMTDAQTAQAIFDQHIPPTQIKTVNEAVETSMIRFNW